MKLLVPNSIPLTLHLPDGVQSVIYDVRSPIPPEHRDAEAIVVWASPAERLVAMVDELTQVRFVQALMAGTEVVEAAGFGPQVQLCSGRGLHDAPVAEHALALILAAARKFHETAAAQAGSRWTRFDDANRPFATSESFSTLTRAHVAIWGFGSIGTRLAKYLTPLGARVSGIATRAGERDGFDVVTPMELPSLLPTADVLVNILPATDATAHVVNKDVLDLLPQRAWLVNVGRGATVDTAAVIEALNSGSIAGAALDVFETEPLPAASALWRTPNVIITPHSAGGRPEAPERLIQENVARFLAGRNLRNQVRR